MIKKNVGKVDRNIRIFLGLLFLFLGLFIIKNYQLIVISSGIILILTGFLRFCGLYAILGINTCKRN